jgi:hypothetical protein
LPWKLSEEKRLLLSCRGNSESTPIRSGSGGDRAFEALPGVLFNAASRNEKERDALEEELYRKIGKLKVENDWLKKNFSSSVKGQASLDRTMERAFRGPSV